MIGTQEIDSIEKYLLKKALKNILAQDDLIQFKKLSRVDKCLFKKARINYEDFHNVMPGSATVNQVLSSSAGLYIWANCCKQDQYEHKEPNDKEVWKDALKNYEYFHNLIPGSATVNEVRFSSAGLTGWRDWRRD